MNVKFNKVKLNNFMSFESATFSLDDRGFVSICGENESDTDGAKSNGSGKSSILESIVWAITGETIRGTKDVVRLGVDECSVCIDFYCDDHRYEITRTKSNASTSNIVLLVDGENKSGKGVRDTQRIIEDSLPELTKDLLESVIVLGQGLPNRFTSNTPSGRKEILEKLTKTDFMIQEIKSRISDRDILLKKILSDEKISLSKSQYIIDELYKSISKKEEELKGLSEDSLRESVRISRDIVDSMTYDIANLSSQIEESETKAISLQESRDSNHTKFSGIESEVFKKKDKLERDYNDVVSTYRDMIKELEGSILAKESVYDVCPTCGRKMEGVVRQDTTQERNKLAKLKLELREMEEAHKEDIDDNEKRLITATDEYQEIEGRLYSEICDIRDIISSLKKTKSDKEYQLNHCRDELSRQNAQLEMCESSKKRLEDSLLCDRDRLTEEENNKSSIESKLYHCNDSLSTISKMSTIASRDFRGVLLGSVIEYLNNRAKDFSVSIFGNDGVRIYQEGNNLNISFGNKLYESLSGGEQKKVDIIVQFAIRDLLCNYMNFSCNFLAIDEIVDSLDMMGCQRVVEFITNKLSDIQTVFIITHRQDLQVPCDEEIVVVKNKDGISSVK